MSTKEKRAGEIQDSIRQVLLKDWDPVGVLDVPEAQDEYDGYIGGVYHLIADGADSNKIADHLSKIESEMMGFNTEPQKLLPVAEKLVKIKISLE